MPHCTFHVRGSRQEPAFWPAAARLYSTFLKVDTGAFIASRAATRDPVIAPSSAYIDTSAPAGHAPIRLSGLSYVSNRDSSRAADVGCHAPPRGVRMCHTRPVERRLIGGRPIGRTDQPSTTASSCRDSSACDPSGETRLLVETRCTSISHFRPSAVYSSRTSAKAAFSNSVPKP